MFVGFHDYMVIYRFYDECVSNLNTKLRSYALRYSDLVFASNFHFFIQDNSLLKGSTRVVLKTFLEPRSTLIGYERLTCTQEIGGSNLSPSITCYKSSTGYPFGWSFLYCVSSSAVIQTVFLFSAIAMGRAS